MCDVLLSWSDDEEFGELLVGDTVLQKRWAQGLSFVGKDDRCTFCFTSSYGQVRYIISFCGLPVQYRKMLILYIVLLCRATIVPRAHSITCIALEEKEL